jgi:RNA polymerase sigma-70 factor (ECF subfamily)
MPDTAIDEDHPVALHYDMRASAPLAAIEPALTQPRDSDEQDPEDPIDVIYRLHGRPLYRYLLRITFGDRLKAEDLLQETLFRAWRFLQANTTDVECLRPWLYTIAKRVAIDADRARQARPTEVTIAEAESLPSGHDDIERILVVLTMRRALMSLTEDHRQVLVEIYYHGRSAREAAEVLGIPEGTAKSRAFYALRALAAAAGETGSRRLGAILNQGSRAPGTTAPRKRSLPRPVVEQQRPLRRFQMCNEGRLCTAPRR